MKGIVRKNQIIITSLAILIAVAGYLNYTERNVMKQTNKSEKESVNGGVTDSSMKDVSADALKEFENDTLLKGDGDIESNDNDPDTEQANGEESKPDENSNGDKKSEPGEAVFTNAGTFSANAKLSREQLRAQNKETLMNMLNSGNLSDTQKSEITNEMIHMTEIAELENEVETLLEAKGFSDVVVSISDESVDVVVNMTDVSDSQRAQIEDIVKRKTECPASGIVITPITDQE